MLAFTALLSLGLSLVAQTNALPIVARDDTSSYNASLPMVKIFGTGGTIASKGSTSTTTAGYSVGLTVDDLIESVPDLADVANLEYLQISNVGSNSLNYTHLMPLHHNISQALEEDGFDGAVVTHGTDTMEETAFFLELTLNTTKPVAIVGAMRPSTATSADGPMNLYQAVKVAGSEETIGRGTVVVLNDRIAPAMWVTKQDANTLDTFRAFEMGYLGMIIDNDIEYYYPPTRPTGYHYFDISGAQASDIPEVIILYSYQGLNPDLIKHAVEDLGAKGIILAGSGAGSWTDSGNIVNEEIYKKYGIPIVQSHRTMDGSVPVGDAQSYTIASGFLNPQKARILLQLCLYSGYSEDQIRTVFSGVYGG